MSADRSSATAQIPIHSAANSSPSSTAHVIHRPNCRLYQPPDALSAPAHPSTSASPSSFAADAPAASPELSEVMDSPRVLSPGLNDERIRSLSSNKNSSLSPSLSPKFPRTRLRKPSELANAICPDVNTLPSANNVVQNLLVEPSSKRNSIHFCECHREDDDDGDDDGEEDDDDDEDEEHVHHSKKRPRSKVRLLFDQYCLSYLVKFRLIISNFVDSKYFRRIVLSAIVVNTLSMGIEYHGQPPSLTNALEYSNLVFTCLFAVEMILKIIAEGCLPYIKNAYNIFDGCIVVMSVVELQGHQNSGLSVLRTFRLLRVLKLVRFMPTLRRQLVRTKVEQKCVSNAFRLYVRPFRRK